MEKVKYIKDNIRIYIGLVAVIVSSIIINICIRAGYSFDSIIIGREQYEQIITLPLGNVAIVVVLKRLKQLALVYVLYKLFGVELGYSIVLCSLAFVFGGFLSVQAFYSGFMGIVEFILYLLPHYVFYILIIRIMYTLIKYSNKGFWYAFALITLLFLSGILCELFFSRFFLNGFYQYMVSA